MGLPQKSDGALLTTRWFWGILGMVQNWTIYLQLVEHGGLQTSAGWPRHLLAKVSLLLSNAMVQRVASRGRCGALFGRSKTLPSSVTKAMVTRVVTT